MNRPHLPFVVGLLILAIFGPSASAMYHPGLGRFLQRDVLAYVDGMSLYQYGRSNPIVRTDPTGGCSQRQREAAIACNCYCVDNIKLKGVIDPNPRNAQAEVKVTITGSWKPAPAGKKGGLPRVEWFEWYTEKPTVSLYNKLEVKTWHELYSIVPGNSTFAEINPRTADMKNVYTLSDSPGVTGYNVDNHDQKAYFAIRASSTPECGCPKPHDTVFATHAYRTGDKGYSNRFQNLTGLPPVPGDPPFKP